MVTSEAEIDCVIRDHSAGGVRLVFPRPVDLPATGILATAGGRRPVRVVWTADREAGVAYAGPAA